MYEQYVGRCVSIEWFNRDWDWNNFKVLAHVTGKDGMGYMWLQGLEQDNAPHDGIPFTASEDEVFKIKSIPMRQRKEPTDASD